jgi:hypothetical protein
MSRFEEGTVVICATGQAGTVIDDQNKDNLWVLLANGNIWHGAEFQCREPQSQEDLDACPLDVDRFEERERAPRKLRDRSDD